jgi:hypothetical protein
MDTLQEKILSRKIYENNKFSLKRKRDIVYKMIHLNNNTEITMENKNSIVS